MFTQQITQLRIALAASLKHSPYYGGSSENDFEKRELWKKVLNGEPLPIKSLTESILGDMFASWYQELRIHPEDYDATVKLFFK